MGREGCLRLFEAGPTLFKFLVGFTLLTFCSSSFWGLRAEGLGGHEGLMRDVDGLAVVVNEVLYDPVGQDAGFEFVELFNRRGEPLCLSGWVLETGNGAYENRWTEEWRGTQGDTIQAHSFFVIGEERVLPRPDFVTGLDLQNGPDASRLVTPHGGLDVVGWGDLAYSEYYEGLPAERASPGSSLGRDPDGADSDLNSEDFRVFASPSPGDFNHPPFDLALECAGLSRYTSTSGSDIDIACRLVNAGVAPCGDGARVVALISPFAGSTYVSCDLDPGERTKAVVRLPHPGEGIHTVLVWLTLEPDRWHGNDSISTTIVLPPAPVVVNEVMFKPAGPECEWVEVFAHAGQAISIKGWTLEDHRGTRRKITDDEVILTGGLFLLVEDEEVFSRAHPDLSADTFLRPQGGWPTLNDVDGPLGFADIVVVRDALGTMIDSVAYRQRWSKPGVSIERIDPRGPSTDPSNWSPHYGETCGSPGCRNSVSFALSGDANILTLSPQSFTPDSDGKDDLLAISIKLGTPSLVRVSVFDLNGRPIKTLVDGEVIDASRITFWDGSGRSDHDAPTGVYLVLLEAKETSSGLTRRAKLPVVLVRR